LNFLDKPPQAEDNHRITESGSKLVNPTRIQLLRSLWIAAFTALAACSPAATAPARREPPPSQATLDAIASRGRLLAQMDQAAWKCTDAVRAQRQISKRGGAYIVYRNVGVTQRRGHPLAGRSSRHRHSREKEFSSFPLFPLLAQAVIFRLRAPVFFSFGVGPWSAPVTHQDQGIGSFLKKNSSRPWQVNLPQKTVGTTPPPTVADSQILWLSLSGV
jgi:hypothetical protein